VRVFVREYRFKGNTVFKSNQLARIVAPYQNREVDTEDLEEARRALTLHYVQAGYINSGAVLEDQSVQHGIVTFTLIEGRLSDIEVTGNKWLRKNYVRKRIALRAGPPLNLNEMRDTLLDLKGNPNIKRINAELRPGPVPGTSLLGVRLEENSPWHFGLQLRNDRPPSVGAEVLEALASHSNLSGNSDALELRYGIAERTRDGVDFSGVDNLGATYTIPVTARDTTLQLYYNRSDVAIIEEPFGDLDIESESFSYGFTVRQPIWRDFRREIHLGFTGERRESKTFLLGEPFSFSPGAVDGKTQVTAARFFQEWIERSLVQVLALRSTFSWGVDLFGATDDGTARDGKFLTWQGQAQYVRRLFGTQNQFLANVAYQWASDPLLSVEQFSLGGLNTVRGYRENQVVRDSAVFASAEFHLPVWLSRNAEPILQLAPFFDYGEGWYLDAPTPRRSSLMSAGIGLLFTPNKKIFAKIYWGHPFRDFDNSDDDLQDYGLHFRINVNFF
jgi:hemolysin activation/secretion protein